MVRLLGGQQTVSAAENKNGQGHLRTNYRHLATANCRLLIDPEAELPGLNSRTVDIDDRAATREAELGEDIILQQPPSVPWNRMHLRIDRTLGDRKTT